MTITETVREKAWRLIHQGRVTILYQSEDVLAGIVQGDHGLYAVQIDPDGWHCDCPAHVRCSHVEALDTQEAIGMTDAPTEVGAPDRSHQRYPQSTPHKETIHE